MAETLKPWYAVAIPHEDIRAGRLEEAVFAANIWAVVQGTAPEVYLNPEEFFRKTYMTVGLATVLKRVSVALQGGEAGDRIISLQTAFGGGKTHTLVALYHLAKHAGLLKGSPASEDLRRVLDNHFPDKVRGVAVFTNASCDATQGRKTPEGVHTHTLWGELALQLGGKALYEKVRANDETQRVPHGLFVEVLRTASPCLILLDELADYCVGAAAVPVGDTTLADQTISFIQQLTEAVQQVPGAVVVATLPASKFEVAQSEKGQEAFITLEKRFQRLGADVRPVADDEIYAVVRSRLFESVSNGDKDYPRKVATEYQATYAAHSGEVPAEAAKTTYRDQIERCYPFHPALIDALYMRWGSHPDFQRTRGVLRLLASVVGDLWKHRDTYTESQPLIQPCHIRWSVDAMQAALTRLWGPAYQTVVAADVLGEKSTAAALDEERGGDYRRERIAEGLAAAMLLGSFGGQGAKSGFTARDLKLACSRPGLNWNYHDGALLELEDRGFFLYTALAGSLGKRYWFGTKPTLNKLLVQYRQQFAGKNFDQEILDALNTQSQKGWASGPTWRILVNPDPELPEQRSLCLLLLPPSLAWGEDEAGKVLVKNRVMELSTKCGAKDRLYRNTLLFLATTSRGLSKLRQAYSERAALRAIQSDYGSQLDGEQKDDLKKRIEAADKSALEALGPAYTIALRIAKQEVEPVVLSDARTSFPEHLGYLWKTLVEDEEWILPRVGSVTLKDTGLVPETGAIRVRDAVDAFLRFSDKPMIASKEAVSTGLAQACKDGLVGIGRGVTVSNLQAKYCRQSVFVDPNEDGVWVIPPFEIAPLTPPLTGAPQPRVGEPTGGGGVQPGPVEGPVTPPTPTKPVVRRLVIRGSVPQESWADIFRAFVGPAARMHLKKLSLGIQFEMETGADQSLDENDQTLKTMREAARQLGLEFEAGE
ncbi:MAG: ATP-binding protein [Chloroflexi bacterium]|nr:ATP-binding protein [Chloroflexota bacterium]